MAKPEIVACTQHLVNLGRLDQEYSVNFSSVPAVLLQNSPLALSENNGTLPAVQATSFRATFNTSGLPSGTYNFAFIVTKGSREIAADGTMTKWARVTFITLPIRLFVSAEPSIRSTLRAPLSTRAPPVAGEVWESMQIEPRDMDGYPISKNVDSYRFMVSLARVGNAQTTTNETGSVDGTTEFDRVVCEVTDSLLARCSLLSIVSAGEWTVQAKFEGTDFIEESVRIECPIGTYESVDSRCVECETDRAKCNTLGTTLAGLELKRGYWRYSIATAAVYECPLPMLCAGGSMIANANDTNRTVVGDPNLSCQRSNATGLPIAHGPVCSICEVRVKATCL